MTDLTTLTEIDVSYLEGVLRKARERRAYWERRRDFSGEQCHTEAEAFYDGMAQGLAEFEQQLLSAIEDAEAQELLSQQEVV